MLNPNLVWNSLTMAPTTTQAQQQPQQQQPPKAPLLASAGANGGDTTIAGSSAASRASVTPNYHHINRSSPQPILNRRVNYDYTTTTTYQQRYISAPTYYGVQQQQYIGPVGYYANPPKMHPPQMRMQYPGTNNRWGGPNFPQKRHLAGSPLAYQAPMPPQPQIFVQDIVTDDTECVQPATEPQTAVVASKKSANNKSTAAPEATTKSSGKQHQKQRAQASGGGKRGGASGSGAGGDKAFTHPWHKTTLKGHTGQLFDMSFSPDGEYLASCDEATTSSSNATPNGSQDDLSSSSPTDHEEYASTSPSSSNSSGQNSAAGSPRAVKHTNQAQALTRRQRKNRKLNDVHENQSQRKNSSGSTSNSSNNKSKRNANSGSVAVSVMTAAMSAENRIRALTPPLKEHIKLNMAEWQLAKILLENYIPKESDLLQYGYPVYDDKMDGVMIFCEKWGDANGVPIPKGDTSASPSSSLNVTNTSAFDVNAREFVPGAVEVIDIDDDGLHEPSRRRESTSLSGDSGQGSGSDSPRSGSTDSDGEDSDNTDRSIRECLSNLKSCVRCNSHFTISESGAYHAKDQCFYHYGRLHRIMENNKTFMVFTCCNQPIYNRGCQHHSQHVWSGTHDGLNGPLSGYVETAEPEEEADDDNYGVYSIDCEMCYTLDGMELTKVTVVKSDGRMCYEKLVKPRTKIVDYNTRFSGITEKMLSGRGVRTLAQVQADLLQFINARTILIGHAINNDLRVLKLLHKNVIDTSLVFPHHCGLPYRQSLRQIVKFHLHRDIQTSEQGHCSFEDSRACLEVLLWHVRRNHANRTADATFSS